MPLEIIGAGYGRTGTLSTFTALNELGFKSYHMMEVIMNKANKGHLDFWYEVANSQPGLQHNWERVFGGYRATVDNPGCCVWQELFEANPQAKVLLTLHPRGPEAWYKSTINTIYFTERMWQFKLLAMVVPMMRKMGVMSRKLIWERSHRKTMENQEAAIARYHQHIEEVKNTVPAEQLLIYSVDQGWEPLCNFLGVKTPDKEFPNVNDRKEVKKAIAGFTKGAYVIVAVGAALLAATIYGLIHLVG